MMPPWTLPQDPPMPKDWRDLYGTRHIYNEQWHECTLPDGTLLHWVTGWADFNSYLADQRNRKASEPKRWCRDSRVETASTPRFVDHSAKKVG